MLLPRFMGTVWVSLMILGAGAVSGQNYPDKPIRIIAVEAGGSGDFTVRLIAQGISGPLGQPVIVDNRGNIGMGIAAKASPDGYTLLFNGPVIWLLPFLQDNIPYDPIRDFSPITAAVSTLLVVVVNSSLPVKSVKELIALAKARPGEFNYASGSAGSSTHLAGELFKSMASVNIVHVPYKGTGPALNALIGGEVQLMFSNSGSAAPHVKSGRLRALAVTSAQPSALVPGVPTVAATGLPGYESVAMLGLFAPAKTPEAITNRLNREIVRVVNRADVKERLLNTGLEVVGSSPEQFASNIKSEVAKWGKVIKDAGIRAE